MGKRRRRAGVYPVKLTVFCDDRFGMLKQITTVIGDAKTNIRNIEARTANGQASVDAVLDVADMQHLEQIVGGIRKIPGMHDVQRLQKFAVVVKRIDDAKRTEARTESRIRTPAWLSGLGLSRVPALPIPQRPLTCSAQSELIAAMNLEATCAK